MYNILFRNIRLNVWLAIIILTTAMAITGCSPDQQPTENSESNNTQQGESIKKATIMYSWKSNILDPNNDWGPLRAGVTETLVRFNENREFQPWLATKWETQDNMTWMFTIRDGVTFQDGTKLDAAAAKDSFERGIAVSKPLASALKIESMKAEGQVLTIVTKEPHPALLSELVHPYASVSSVASEQKMGTEAFNNAPVGTGPFTVRSFSPGVEIVLDRYDDYWDGTAKLNEVSYKFNSDANIRALALQSKEADIAYHLPVETLTAINQDSAFRVESINSLRVNFFIYNQQREQMKDVNVRKAIDLLIDRESVVNDVMLGHAIAANSPFNSTLPFGNKGEVNKLNQAEALKLLEKAGYTKQADGKLVKDGKPLVLQLISYNLRPEIPLMAQLLQSEASKAGITMEIKTVESPDTYIRENQDWDLTAYSTLSAPRGDGTYFLNSAFVKGGSLNTANIEIEKLKPVLEELNATEAVDERIRLTQEAVQIINDELPHSYVIYPNIVIGINERITGWTPGAEEFYIVTNKLDVK